MHRRSDSSYSADLKNMNSSAPTGNLDVHKFVALWTAFIDCPAESHVYKVQRGGDPGLGVDMTINGS